MVKVAQFIFYLAGLAIFSLGISVAIEVKHLGIHPWDILNVALYQNLGFSIGTWNIICGLTLIGVALVLDRRYITIATFFNAFIVGSLVDLYLWLDFLPSATYTWMDYPVIFAGIIIMGIGGGLYNSADIGSGPRDGFMLSISDKTGMSISKVRIIVESLVLLIGFLLGGPVFIVSFIFTFIQSPVFQKSLIFFRAVLDVIREKNNERPLYEPIGEQKRHEGV